MTACLTDSPKYFSASAFILQSTFAEISFGVNCLPSTSTTAMSFLPALIVYGSHLLSDWTLASLNFLPINLFTEKIVDLGFMTIWRLATSPTIFLMGSTTDWITFLPSAEWITLGAPPSMTATQEFVVPKSIPIIFAINSYLP